MRNDRSFLQAALAQLGHASRRIGHRTASLLGNSLSLAPDTAPVQKLLEKGHEVVLPLSEMTPAYGGSYL